jgi:hypothetical protein
MGPPPPPPPPRQTPDSRTSEAAEVGAKAPPVDVETTGNAPDPVAELFPVFAAVPLGAPGLGGPPLGAPGAPGIGPLNILCLVRNLCRRVRLRELRVILDAGASTSNNGLRRLDRFGKTVFLIRSPRRHGYVNAWKKLPRDRFTHLEEPGSPGTRCAPSAMICHRASIWPTPARSGAGR